jgi:hypothetical protein
MTQRHERVVNGVSDPQNTYRYGSFSFANENEDPYFVTHAKPEGLDIVKRQADEFVRFQCAKERSVVLVTSGGSTVPLEVNLQRALLIRIKRSGLLTILVLGQEVHVLVWSCLMVI